MTDTQLKAELRVEQSPAGRRFVATGRMLEADCCYKRCYAALRTSHHEAVEKDAARVPLPTTPHSILALEHCFVQTLREFFEAAGDKAKSMAPLDLDARDDDADAVQYRKNVARLTHVTKVNNERKRKLRDRLQETAATEQALGLIREADDTLEQWFKQKVKKRKKGPDAAQVESVLAEHDQRVREVVKTIGTQDIYQLLSKQPEQLFEGKPVEPVWGNIYAPVEAPSVTSPQASPGHAASTPFDAGEGSPHEYDTAMATYIDGPPEPTQHETDADTVGSPATGIMGTQTPGMDTATDAGSVDALMEDTFGT
eukprot:NODE_2459_length_1060_cov_60.687031_g2441_i0.p1 GENE.NODE_2459_length_1060_cov_60.687031_g2441_i0~~NODE_2459_length_1060_cov_60.687031_g2441_i0.p1  ORF type:complete len:329 (+),score=63.28 NODE_2459_length_1060_cov_60.687031_g2441_i0:54-989(+)